MGDYTHIGVVYVLAFALSVILLYWILDTRQNSAINYVAVILLGCAAAYKSVSEGIRRYSIRQGYIEVYNCITRQTGEIPYSSIAGIVCGSTGGQRIPTVSYQIEISSTDGIARLGFGNERDMARFVSGLPSMLKGKIFITDKNEMALEEMKSLPEKPED